MEYLVTMIETLIKTFFGSQHERDLKQLLPILHRINEKEGWAMSLPPEAFPEQTKLLKKRYGEGESLNDLLPEAFALAREAARRTLGERPYDVQLFGGIVLHQGKIMEMKTGEGKTLSSVTAAYLNSLSGNGVHIITVNDYLAERDSRWMGPVYEYLGITVGVILSNMDNEARRTAYRKDITFGTNNEFGFDYLRDNMRWTTDGRVQWDHHYCIIDEIDSILIDEARTPLIISGQAEDDTRKFTEVNRYARQLVECKKDPETGEYPEELEGDFKIDEKSKRITFTDEGMNHIEKLLLHAKIIEGSLFVDENFEYIHYFTQAMKAHLLFHRDVDYMLQDEKVEIVDEFTGRVLHGRRYSDGLHQAIEAKEGIKVAKRNRTLATITFQNFFRMYDKISGMTGTADTEATEFAKIYNLDVVVIPTNLPVIRSDENDVIYFTAKFKFDAIVEEISKVHSKGQPLLVGTVSIEKSELLSKLLTGKGIRHEVLNAKNHQREALIIAEAGAKGSVTIATNMAGRGTDIKLGGNPDFRAGRRAGTNVSKEEYEKVYHEEFEKWMKDYQEIRDLGGLYVLATERHESRRIDNQLRGRSGRQGDPGKSRFFISLDDDLMRLFANESVRNLMGKAGMSSGEPLFHPWINNAIEKAQSKVEERNFEIRKHLLEYDDVLNEQRKFIYDQRDGIIDDEKLSDRIHTVAVELGEEIFEKYPFGSDATESSMKSLLGELRSSFFFTPHDTTAELQTLSRQDFQNTFIDYLTRDLEEKNTQIGKQQLDAFIRYEYLRAIDQKWQDHLENLEALREAVYLRSYAQKNPLLEYKLEGFQIFDRLIEDIRKTVTQKIVRVKVQEPQTRGYRAPKTIQASHQEYGQFGSAPTSRQGQANRPEKAQVRRQVPKVGRNEPCPCGSGKKYKHCCGR